MNPLLISYGKAISPKIIKIGDGHSVRVCNLDVEGPCLSLASSSIHCSVNSLFIQRHTNGE
uniref:Uncharacterized protein n=1 Tax=Lepeophtheirus salmonis TaxID=72036 RepID=A0A0K2VEK7_LEPSM